jgi:VanZ family protein
MVKTHLKRWILTLITIAFVLFIFRNSIFPGPQSSEQSRYVMNLLNRALGFLQIPVLLSEHFVRKTAHFAEYFALGALLSATIKSYHRSGREAVFTELFLLLLVPVIDEWIQLFRPGRGSSVADVLLDFAGGLVGMILLDLSFHFRRSGRPTSAAKAKKIHYR